MDKMLMLSYENDRDNNMPGRGSPRGGRVTAENLLSNFMETFQENLPRQNSQKGFLEAFTDDSVNKNHIKASFQRLFGRQKPVHHLLGGGKSADVLLWRNKKISIGVLSVATVIWLMFEWLNYHLLTLCCLGLSFSMLFLFLWTNLSVYINRYDTRIPRFAFREDVLVNAAILLTGQINEFLGFLQDVASGRNLKMLVGVIGGLWFLAMIGSWCNFLTIVYMGFVAAHTLPVLYERYEDQVDSFIYNFSDEMKRHYGRFDSKLWRRIPRTGSGKRRKHE